MVMPVRGYAAHSATSALGLFSFVRRDPRPNDVAIEIEFAGVCHSDLHTVRGDWGVPRYPVVPGHEIIGRVTAMGAEVTLFSRSPGKEADAQRLGASHVVISTDPAQMKAVRGQFDLIIDTVPYVHELNPYVSTLAVSGTLVLVGYLGPLEEMLNTAPMVMGRKSVAGSVIGGIAETQEMLDFCGQHGITADIERIDIGSINDAYERMLKSDVKYRFVIDIASFQGAA